MAGEVQGTKPEPSSEHSKLEPDSLAVKSKLTVALVVVAGGPFVIVVAGGVVSTTMVRLAVVPRLPAVSVARTSKVCVPWLRGAVVCAEVQAVKAAESTRHSKVACSLAVNAKVGVVSLVGPLGPFVIVVAGGVVSTTMVRLAVFPRLPAVSVARTSKVCVPWLRGGVVCAEVQAVKGAESTRHSKVACSLAVNAKVGVGSLVGPLGPAVIVVAGGVVSTRMVRLAVFPRLPAVSVARTSKVCVPWLRGGVVCAEVQVAKGAESTRHSKVACSLAVNAKVGVGSLVGRWGRR